MKKKYKTLILILLLPFLGFSNSNEVTHTKQKNIKKTYLVNADAGINIENSYGNINISTWDENKIDIDVVITVSGDNENWVNQRINDISIDITALKSLISAKTTLGNSSSNNKGQKNSFEINYTIKIPKNGSVKLNNKYGNITTTDLWSSTDIFCKYGKISLGKLNSTKNNIQIEYCQNSNINYLNNGSLLARYSSIKIDELTNLDLNSDYTDIAIQDAGYIKYNSKYGNIKIQTVKTLDASGNYLKIKIGEIDNQLKLITKYSNVDINSITAKANDITIVSGYTNLNIGYQTGFAFDFNISVRYANFNFENDLEVINKEESNHTKHYNGFYKKKGSNNLTITSDYGNVNLIQRQ